MKKKRYVNAYLKFWTHDFLPKISWPKSFDPTILTQNIREKLAVPELDWKLG